jgi:cytochrome c556
MMAQHQKQNMRDHLVVVQEVVAALGVRDFAKVAQSAKRMGYSDEMGQMCKHMGAGAPGFTEQALAFHHSADQIAQAATKNDSAAVLSALAATLSTCTTCHAAYKQKLVDALSE